MYVCDSLSDMGLDVAGPRGTSEMAYNFEQCQCPANYVSSSCERCANGYYRSKEDPYLTSVPAPVTLVEHCPVRPYTYTPVEKWKLQSYRYEVACCIHTAHQSPVLLLCHVLQSALTTLATRFTLFADRMFTIVFSNVICRSRCIFDNWTTCHCCPLSTSSAVILNHISSHFLIPLSDSSLICTVPAICVADFYAHVHAYCVQRRAKSNATKWRQVVRVLVADCNINTKTKNENKFLPLNILWCYHCFSKLLWFFVGLNNKGSECNLQASFAKCVVSYTSSHW